jgi:DNA-binding MarR family transcriptional regulator
VEEATPSPEVVAAALATSLSLIHRRLRQKTAGNLTPSERSALSRLDRGGPMTATELARQEQISPQSIGATLAALIERGLVERTPDPDDRRQMILALSSAGRATMHARRAARSEFLTQALESGFSAEERAQLLAVAPLIERLAETAADTPQSR